MHPIGEPADSAPAAASRPLRVPIHGELVARLRDMIVEGELPEGAKLSERALCESLGVSRSPLREALRALAAEGLVDLLPNRSARVSQVSVADTLHMLEVLTLLESSAAERACARIRDDQVAEIGELHYRMVRHHLRGEYRDYFQVNLEIHLKLVDAAGNPCLSETYRNINGRLRRYRFQTHTVLSEDGKRPLDFESYSLALQDHERMLKALQARDSEMLKRVIQEHYKVDALMQRSLS